MYYIASEVVRNFQIKWFFGSEKEKFFFYFLNYHYNLIMCAVCSDDDDGTCYPCIDFLFDENYRLKALIGNFKTFNFLSVIRLL